MVFRFLCFQTCFLNIISKNKSAGEGVACFLSLIFFPLLAQMLANFISKLNANN